MLFNDEYVDVNTFLSTCDIYYNGNSTFYVHDIIYTFKIYDYSIELRTPETNIINISTMSMSSTWFRITNSTANIDFISCVQKHLNFFQYNNLISIKSHICWQK